jgi:hypothetical protein
MHWLHHGSANASSRQILQARVPVSVKSAMQECQECPVGCIQCSRSQQDHGATVGHRVSEIIDMINVSYDINSNARFAVLAALPSALLSQRLEAWPCDLYDFVMVRTAFHRSSLIHLANGMAQISKHSCP